MSICQQAVESMTPEKIEILAYQRYRATVLQDAYARCCEKYPDMDPEDFPVDEVWEGDLSFDEWKEMQNESE